MSLLAMIKPKGRNGFGYGSTAEDVSQGRDLNGKTFLVTGCNSGLGLETARVLALRGGKVIGLARTLEKAKVALSQLSGGQTLPLECELSDPKSVRKCIETIRSQNIKIDAIICNAGVMATPTLIRDHGYERQFFTNHIGHFTLVTGLLDSLTPQGRVIMVSSSAHKAAPKAAIEFDNLKGEKSYHPWKAYGQAKMANLVFAKELARRFAGTSKTAYALHPGVIATNLARDLNPVLRTVFRLFNPLLLKSAAQGAATQVYLATAADPGAASGSFFADCNVAKPRPDAENPELGKKLWEVSNQIVSTL